MRITEQIVGHCVAVLVLKGGTADFRLRQPLLRHIWELRSRGFRHLLLDIRGVRGFTYAGLSVLELARGDCPRGAGAFCIIGPSMRICLPIFVQILFRFSCYPSLDEGLASFLDELAALNSAA